MELFINWFMQFLILLSLCIIGVMLAEIIENLKQKK